jgi:hypothetical protein
MKGLHWGAFSLMGFLIDPTEYAAGVESFPHALNVADKQRMHAAQEKQPKE